MLPAVIDDVLVDLVGDGQYVELLAQSSNALQFIAGEHAPCRIVGRVDDDGFGSRAKRLPQPFYVHPEVRRFQGHEGRFRASQHHGRQVHLVIRFQDDDLFARVDRRHDAGQHRFGYADSDSDVGIRINDHAIETFHLVGDSLSQSSIAPGDGVLVDVGLDGADSCLLHSGRGGEVGEALRQVESIVFKSQSRHVTDDRLGQSRYTVCGFHGCLLGNEK